MTIDKKSFNMAIDLAVKHLELVAEGIEKQHQAMGGADPKRLSYSGESIVDSYRKAAKLVEGIKLT